jgi:hypothetical protein
MTILTHTTVSYFEEANIHGLARHNKPVCPTVQKALEVYKWHLVLTYG